MKPTHPLTRIRQTVQAVCLALPVAAAAQTAATPTPPAPPASAASAPAVSATTLPAITVKATADKETATGPVTGYRAKRSATATKTDSPLNEVPQSISVITADQVRDQASPNMQEALRYSAGVRNEMYGVDNRGDYFSMRGGSEGSVLLDGLRLPLTGWWGVIRNEPFAFERIEVLRGPASVIAGQNGPGGVVNLVSKRPQAEAMREVQLQVGTNDHKQLAADLTGPVDKEGRLLYRLVALHKDSGTQVNHAVDERSYFAPSLTWKPAAGTSLNVYYAYQKDNTGNVNAFFPIEGTLTPAPNGPLPTDTFIGEPDWDRYGGERNRFGYQLEQQLGSDWTLRHNLRHDRTDGYIRTMYAAWWLGFANADGSANPNGRYLNRVWYASDDRSTVTNTDLLLEGKLKFGSTQHTLLVGVDAMRGKWNKVDFGEAEATPLDVYSPVYGSFPLPDLGAGATTETRVRNLGVLVQDQIRFDDRFVLVAGLRRDRARTETTGSTVSQDDSATSKNLGGVVLAPGGVSPYVNYSESFEPVAPATDTTTDPVSTQVFKPKRGKQFEAGVKWSPQNQRFTVASAIYQLKEKNRVTTGPTPTTAQQLGEVTVKGFEIEGSATLPAWDIVAQYTYMDATETSDASDRAAYRGKQLAGIPKHSASAWAVHKFARWGLPGVRAGAGVRHIGRSADESGNNGVPAVTLYDLLLAYDHGPWGLAFNVSNLTDKAYIATCLSRGDCWFGAQRRAVLSMAYRW
jgi:iron complex outermembrane receptor protein